MEKSLLIPIALQALLSFFLLFRPSLPRALRLLLIAYCGGLVWFWYAEIHAAVLTLLDGNWFPVIKDTLTTAAVALIWLWPFLLAVTVYLSNDYDARLVLLVLAGFTAIVWIGNFIMRMEP